MQLRKHLLSSCGMTSICQHLDGLQEVFGLTKTPQEAQEEMQKAMDEYLSTKSDSGAADDTAEEATDDAAADDAE